MNEYESNVIDWRQSVKFMILRMKIWLHLLKNESFLSIPIISFILRNTIKWNNHIIFFNISKYCKKLLTLYSLLSFIWSNRMLTEYYVHLVTLKLVVFSALIQKGEDLEAHWLTAQSSNLWRMAGPFNFRAMHSYPIHIQRAPTIKK